MLLSPTSPTRHDAGFLSPAAAAARLAQQKREEADAAERKRLLSAESPLLTGFIFPHSTCNTTLVSNHSALAAILVHDPSHPSRADIRAAAEQKTLAESAMIEKLKSDWQLKNDSIHINNVSVGHVYDYSFDPDKDLAFSGDTPSIKQMIFTSQLKDYQQHERALEINPQKHRIGMAVMTESEREELEYQREAIKDAGRKAVRECARQRAKTVCSNDPVCYIVGGAIDFLFTFDLSLDRPCEDDSEDEDCGQNDQCGPVIATAHTTNPSSIVPNPFDALRAFRLSPSTIHPTVSLADLVFEQLRLEEALAAAEASKHDIGKAKKR